MRRVRVLLKGVVQGVGFRPFVYRLATELGLKGFVRNDTFGVEIEAEGEEEKLRSFLSRLHEEKPPNARILQQEVLFLEPAGFSDFLIKKSEEKGKREVLILPDLATCEDCLKELFDPADRRYLYPFINCTNCGPRFTIIEKLPYDRKNTTMKAFSMCEDCRREYENPSDRRFHAQPNACPVCGPWIELYDRRGNKLGEKEEALEKAAELLRKGYILAVKGLGGFHLMTDATNEESVSLLRKRKKRKEKPFAVMFKDIAQLEKYAELTELEKVLLLSPERPIVLIKRKEGLAPSVAPRLKSVGAFLPYTPLHHLLMSFADKPMVATSGNFSEEPIIKDNEEAFSRLSLLADYLLLHNRDINRRCDDSVVKVIGGFPTPVRRSRGYAPLPIEIPLSSRKRVLAVGGMLKNTFGILYENKAILSQHIGDIDNLSTLRVFKESLEDFLKLYEFQPEIIICDKHPRYETTRFAKEYASDRGIPLYEVQHHYAHILSCMAENGITQEVLGIAWDGTGYGDDGNVWGGEFLIATPKHYERPFHFKYFKLLGGEKAVKEPRRVALSLLFTLERELNWEVFSRTGFSEKELDTLKKMWEKGINSPLTSSVGRLFDGVASLLGILQVSNYEGQAPMILEELYEPTVRDSYPFEVNNGEVDWKPVILALLEEKDKSLAVSRFINTLAEIVLFIAEILDREVVCLSGGVMQNAPLVEKIRLLLEERGFKVYTHQRVPPNDGGLSLGQLFFGAALD